MKPAALFTAVLTVLAMTVGAPAWAGNGQPGSPQLSQATANRLLPIKYGLTTVEALKANGTITADQAGKASADLLKQAAAIAGRPVTVADLAGLSGTPSGGPELSALQRFAGLITFTNILWVLAIILGVVCVVILFGHAIKTLILSMPPETYEVLLGLAGVGLMIGAHWLKVGVREYLAFTGCLLFGGALAIAMTIHGLQKQKVALMLVLAAVAGAVAAVYTSQLNGFLAVAALMSALGFSVIVTPLCYCIGFEDESTLGRATSAAFVMLIGYVLLKIFAVNIPQLMAFETGAVFLGSFVGYLGLLIASSKWYHHRTNYLLFQLVALVAMGAAVAVGSIWQIATLQGIGGTFFVLWLVEKVMEIPSRSLPGWAFKGLIASGVFFAICYLVKSYPEVLQQYLLF